MDALPDALGAIPAQVTLVCTDYFDTLVSRTVHPEDVKRLWAERIVHALDLGLDEGQMYARRAQVERTLCQANASCGKDPEFDVHACYDALWEGLPACRPSREVFRKLALELEVSIECSVQQLDEPLVAWLRQQREAGRRVVLVSDFYLHSQAFCRMLRFHGIEDLFEAVFVSADTLTTKRSGRAFPEILRWAGVAPQQAVMIGDNPEADVNQPRNQGMHAVLLDRSERHAEYQRMAAVSADRGVCERALTDIVSRDEGPFAELSLTLFTFTERLYWHLLGKGVRDVFFLAREGQLLMAMFDRYQRTRVPTPEVTIRAHYLEVSRRSTFLPSLGPLDEEDFDTLFRQYRRISVEEFLLNLGLESLLPTLQGELAQRGETIDLRQREDDLPTSDIYRRLLANQTFRDAYESARSEGRRALLAYLDNFPLQQPAQTLALVDVGWKGTIQDNLYRLMRHAHAELERPLLDIDGYYLGLVAHGNAGPHNRKHGLLFSVQDGATPRYRIFNENRALFEVMLGADHGSARGYRLRPDGTGEPVRGEFSEQSLFESQVRPAQQRMMESFARIDALLAHRYYGADWLADFAARLHARMVFAPAVSEIDWFTGVYHVENFGVFERSEFRCRQQERARLLDQMRFAWGLFRLRGRMDLGFWPWLSCRQRGGQLVAAAYRLYRLR
ncbi:HAD family hydrolase [Paracidovorax citrulli]